MSLHFILSLHTPTSTTTYLNLLHQFQSPNTNNIMFNRFGPQIPNNEDFMFLRFSLFCFLVTRFSLFLIHWQSMHDFCFVLKYNIFLMSGIYCPQMSTTCDLLNHILAITTNLMMDHLYIMLLVIKYFHHGLIYITTDNPLTKYKYMYICPKLISLWYFEEKKLSTMYVERTITNLNIIRFPNML